MYHVQKKQDMQEKQQCLKIFLSTTFYLSAFIGYLLSFKVILPQKYHNNAGNDKTGNLDIQMSLNFT